MAFLIAALVLAAAPPEVALLCGAADDGDFAELRFQSVGATALSQPVTRFTIVPRSTVTGVVVPRTRVVLAVAYTTPAADESWAFSLLRLEAGVAPKVLVDHVGAATRPVVTADGRVFVERGSAGSELNGWRTDDVRIDEVNPLTGAMRTLLSTRGFYAALAGTLGKELFVYRVDASGARLEAINIDTREVRTLRASMPATAHDFAVDAVHGALLYTLGSETWRIERVDLKTLQARTVVTGPSVALLPTIFPDGTVAYAPNAGAGLRAVNAESTNAVLTAHGPGYERVRFFAGGYALGLHEIPSDFPTPFAVSLSDGTAATLLAPAQMRLDLAGVLP